MGAWGVEDQNAYVAVPIKPAINNAQYFLLLPVENVVLYKHEISTSMAPTTFTGDFASFANMFPNSPLIPLDAHTALVLNWVNVERMSRNCSYLNDTIRAAIALVA